MELIRKENGNVELRNSGVLVWSMAQLPVEIKPIDKGERDHVKLFQNDGRVEYIYVDDLTETQIEPNAAVPFAGTVFDLADLLSADFFFEVINYTSIKKKKFFRSQVRFLLTFYSGSILTSGSNTLPSQYYLYCFRQLRPCWTSRCYFYNKNSSNRNVVISTKAV